MIFIFTYIRLSLLIILLSSCSSVINLSSYKPNIQFIEPYYDFGISGPNSKIIHKFKFENIGPSPLNIERITTDCDCTAVVLKKNKFLHGEIGDIYVEFETKEYENELEKLVSVFSNDPKNPVIHLIVKGIVKRHLIAVPSVVNFGNIKKGQTLTKTIKLYQTSQNELILYKFKANKKYFNVEISRFYEENSRGIKISIALNSSIATATLTEAITLYTNSKKRSRLDIPIFANIL